MGRSNKEYLEKANLDLFQKVISDYIDNKKKETPNYKASFLASDAGINPSVITKIMSKTKRDLIPTIDTIRALGNLLGEDEYKKLLVYAGYGECGITIDDEEDDKKVNYKSDEEIEQIMNNAIKKYPLHPESDSMRTTYTDNTLSRILYCLAIKNAFGWYVSEICDNELSDLVICFRDEKRPIDQWHFVNVNCKRSTFDLAQHMGKLFEIKAKNPSSTIKISLVLDGYDRQSLSEIESIPYLDFYFSIISIKDKKVTEYLINTKPEYDFHKLADAKLTM